MLAAAAPPITLLDRIARGWDAVSSLAHSLDAEAPPRTPPPTVAAALWYAGHGFQVFPLQPGLKIPFAGSRGCKDATDDEATIRRWWARHPTANLALATGHRVDVIDVDGPRGVLSWARLDGLPPVLGTVSTPRPGGTHLYVAASGKGNRAGIADGIDYRGLGGYVVAPPSVNEAGVRYTWRRPLALSVLDAPPLCTVCGLVMTVVQAGQGTHPCCSAVA